MGIQIVPLTAPLVPGAAAVEQECFSLPWSEAGLSAELEKEGARCFAALSPDGRVIGWAGLESVCGEGSVTNIAVLPAFRQRGIGEALTRALLLAADALSLDRLLLEVRCSNTPAVSLYEKLGFAPLGIRPGFYDAPREDALLMQHLPGAAAPSLQDQL